MDTQPRRTSRSQGAEGGADMNAVFRMVEFEDRIDGRRESLSLLRSDRSESGVEPPSSHPPPPTKVETALPPPPSFPAGFKGVHRAGASQWQTQIYFQGRLHHVGQSDEAASCARTFAACTRAISLLKHRSLLPEPTARPSTKTKKLRSDEAGGVPGGGGAELRLALGGFDGEAGGHTQCTAHTVHTSPRCTADSVHRVRGAGEDAALQLHLLTPSHAFSRLLTPSHAFSQARTRRCSCT